MSGSNCGPSTRRQRRSAIRMPFVRDPAAPFVTRWRRRTVANGDSITFVVRRCFLVYAEDSHEGNVLHVGE
jgi:hypothetical protein